MKFIVVAKYKTPGSHTHNIKRDVIVAEVEAFDQQDAIEQAKQTTYVDEIIGVSQGIKSFRDEPYWAWLMEVEVPEPSLRVAKRKVQL